MAPAIAGLASAAARAIPKIQQFAKGVGAANDFVKQLGRSADDTAKKVIHFADNLGMTWIKMQDIAFKTARTMAMSREQAMNYNEQLLKSTRELATQYGVTERDLANFQRTYSESIGRNVVLTREQLAHMSALSKITDNATAARLVDEFDKLGMSVKTSLVHVGHLQEKAKAYGVNATKFSRDLASNIKLASSYSFKNGVADIEKMTLKSVALRENLQEIMRSSEKFTEIESTLQTSARLQMLGGSSALFAANPMRNMYNAMADPAKYQEDIEKLAKSFVTYNEKTGETTINPLQAQFAKYTAENLGMSKESFIDIGRAKAQGEAVIKQLGERVKEFSPEQLSAIQNLGRGNFNQETKKYEISWIDEYGEHTRNVEDITEKELKIAQDSQATEESMQVDVKAIRSVLERVHGRVRDTKSLRETENSMQTWWDAQWARIQNWWMPTVSDVYNGIGNSMGERRYANGGIVKPIPHAADGMIIPGDSYYGDRVPAMVNSGEMVINQKQQKGLFSLLSSLAVTGGSVYGLNKLGGRVGYGGLGSTMLLANALGGGKTDMKSIIEAHFITRAIKSMKPLKKLTESIGTTATSSMKANTALADNWKNLTKLMSRDWKDLSHYMGNAFKNSMAPVHRFFTTGRIGSFINGTTNFASNAWAYASGKGSAVKNAASAKWDAIKNSKWGEKIGHKYRMRVAEAQLMKANALDWIDNKTAGIRQKFGNKKLEYKLFKAQVLKPRAEEYKNVLRNLFNDGSKAQASKEASRAMSTASKVAEGTTGLAKGGRVLSGLSKAGRYVKGAGALALIGGTVDAFTGVQNAHSQYDARLDEIGQSGMSERDKARAKDRAIREKNTNIGSSVGGAAAGVAGALAGGKLGASAGAAIGTVLLPGVGTAIGGFLGGLIGGGAGYFLGNKAGSAAGGGVGSMFGGSEEEKLIEEEKESAKAIAGNNEQIVKILKSIEGKMPGSSPIASNFGLKPLEMAGSVMKSLPIFGPMLKVAEGVGGALSSGAGANVGPTEIKLNVSGTIKLEGAGKTADLNFDKLFRDPEFMRKITDIVTDRIKVKYNSGNKKGGNGQDAFADKIAH